MPAQWRFCGWRRVLPNWQWTHGGDGDGELVDGVEGVRVVVVVGALPWPGVLGEYDVVDLVDEEVPPPLPGVGGERACACLPAGLVPEEHGPAVLPAEGVRADEPLFAVIGDADGAALAQSGFQVSPRDWQ